MEKGHGRIEIRKLQASSALLGYLDFPYAAQVFRIERSTSNLKGEPIRSERAYGITSLSPEKADSQRLLELSRGHWKIENSLHWVRDVTFDEDRSRVRTGAGPRTLAALQNLAISLCRLNGYRNLAQAFRHLGRNPHRPLELITA